MAGTQVVPVFLTAKFNEQESRQLKDILQTVSSDDELDFQISNPPREGNSILDIAKELWLSSKERGGINFLVADEHTLQEIKDQNPKEKVSFETVYVEGEDLKMFDELIRTRDMANEQDKDEDNKMSKLERLEYLKMKFEEWGDERKETIRFQSFWDSPSRDSPEWSELKEYYMVKISIARLTLPGAEELLGLCEVKDPNAMFNCFYKDNEVIRYEN